VLPALGVERVVGLVDGVLRTIRNQPTVLVGSSRVPLVQLSQVLELEQGHTRAPENRVAVVLGTGTQRVAFEVDAVLGDQEVQVKSLGRCLERVRNVSGVTVLGDGRLALILHVHDLLQSARLAAGAERPADTGPHSGNEARPVRILLAEDSITARSLLRNILEVAGYEVKATVDGAEAWAALKLERFDAVVSDIEMPRMNGFDLTARIRSDPALAELPVVLITALASREDRERGVDVGASAYMHKGDFDQQRLLEVLRRLT
jgi:two-component system chemotaxis sensor kinase CheA